MRLKNSISEFTSNRLALDADYAFRLYKQHGTALRGLLVENLIPDERIEEYLHAVHNVPLDEISPDMDLRQMLLKLQVRRWIFTASSREHALRCMKRVGVDDLFEGIIDCRDCNLVTKHDPSSFKLAMERAGAKDPARCLLLDDSLPNLRTAKALGMKTCLVGLYERETGKRIECAEADYEINRLVEMQDALPALFSPEKKFSSIGDKRYSFVAARHLSTITRHPVLPHVVFVLGGPGAGKGTQCARAAETYNAAHISAGDLLREEQADPASEHGQLITACIAKGEIVPEAITIQLIKNKISILGAKRVLLDGFPRNMENLDGWFRLAYDDHSLQGVLLFEVKDRDELMRRVLDRGKSSGRADDNEETMMKRFKVYEESTLPVIRRLEIDSTVRTIDASQSIEQVWAQVEMALDGWWASGGKERP